MKIERQITISKSHAVSPQLIARTPDDGYIIAGSDNEQRTEAWATRLTSSGDAMWEYLDGSPGSWADSHAGTNRFSGAVVLRDNTVLLCGGKNVDNMPHGLLVHIGADGSAIEQRNVSPHGEQKYASWFNGCARWGDAFVLLGQANSSNSPPAGWLVKLDNRGRMVWEKTDVELTANSDMLVSPDGGLLVTVRAPNQVLLKLDGEGRVLARRPMPGEISLVRPVRPMFPASTIRVVVTDLNTAAKTFWSLDQDLRELTHTGPHAFGLTRAYELPDHSLVLFGSVNARGGTAAAARLYSDNAFAIFLIAPLHESFTLSDAVPTNSAAEYVAVRALVHPAPGTPEASRPGHIVTNETVLAWLEINPRS